MPAAVPPIPVVIAADAARPVISPDDPAGGIVAAIVGRIVTAAVAEEAPMMEMRAAESAAMPATTVPTSSVMPAASTVPVAAATMPTTTAVAANLSGQTFRRLFC